MRFLIDAQLPPRLVSFLARRGHDAVHAASLPQGVDTPDPEITRIADEQQRVVVSKDADFRHSYAVSGHPALLLLVRTGNISNNDLIALFDSRLADIETALTSASFVELHRTVLTVHNSSPRP